MALASSEGPIIFNQAIDGSSSTTLLSGIIATLSTVMPSVTLAGVTTFNLISPQGFGAKLILQLASTNRISLQMTSFDGTLLGAVHYLSGSNGNIVPLIYQCWANVCQVFISVPGKFICDVSFEGPWFFGAGVLFVPQDLGGTCADEVGNLTITDIWWSQGQTNASIYTFRACVDPLDFSACFNGDLMNTDVNSYSQLNQLRLVPVSIVSPWPHFFGDNLLPDMFYYANYTPFYFDPLLAWGTGTVHDAQGKIRGQLYDSVQGSTYRPVDELLTLKDSDGNDVHFINYMGDSPTDSGFSKFATLYLLLDVSATDFAYIY